jgi:S1-C subfamily serine protease
MDGAAIERSDSIGRTFGQVWEAKSGWQVWEAVTRVLVEEERRMPSLTEWKVPSSVQPRGEDFNFDLERVLASVVGLHSIIPGDAFTADTLGVERAGNGVLIDDGLVLTIGYLITEAETVWLHLGDGRVVPGHALGFDQETGFGLVQALGRVDLDPLPLGNSAAGQVDDRVVVGGVGGRTRSVAGTIAAKQEFAGYWEYALEEAIFTHPAHPNWGGAGLISSSGELIGIGSLQIERAREGKNEHLNMIVPIDLLKPVLDDLRKFGRVNKPARPWLGVFSTEIDDKVVVAGVAPKGPAARAEIRSGDLILAVNGDKISSQMQFYRKFWALGSAGVDVPLTLYREGDTFDVSVKSSDRTKFLKGPMLH